MDELNRLLSERRSIRGMIEAYQDLQSKMLSTPGGIRGSEISNHPNDSYIERMLVKADEMREKIAARYIDCLSIERQVFELIEQLSDERSKDILFYRYICGKQWAEIVKIFQIDKRVIYRQHKKALQELEELQRKEG